MPITRDFWNPEVYEILFRMPPPGKAAFDFDNTLVRNDFGEAVMELFLSQGVPSYKKDVSPFLRENTDKVLSARFQNPALFRSLVLSEYESIQSKFGLEASYRWSSWIFSGHSPEELKEISRKVWNEHAFDSGLHSVKIYEPMKELVSHLLENQWEVWIVTSSPQEIVQSVSPLFGIPAERVLGMQLSLENGLHSSEILEPFTYGKGKVERLKVATGGFVDLAFGDSVNDFVLLDSATQMGIFLDRGKGVVPPSPTKVQSVSNWNVLQKVVV
ncbi:HAD family hydrolase [Leptospira borgpetersenii]|uniref:Haloacid dehalogenase-like hydrolase n=1 Tax=Leptospira borgpetersenii str. Brem 328 TaxID=1049780 RepID=A0ABC9SKA3_LEPBO|nr:HAD family hydrolase [Leptospira borgpetersenii]EMN13818.1 haloacid dehalogenase-like hydrolase [Leptospira borgpetersenii str. Brem 307]EMN18260.1 haloacid dehalogenase-like hydrolase [Leptospira borgpetersenii str. Brem 328]